MLFYAVCALFAVSSAQACGCYYYYFPVCGSDGVTYTNPCLFKCASKKDPTIHMVGNGRCTDAIQAKQEDVCVCTFDYNPVCGSNGKTYPNQCTLNCQKRKDSSLKLLKHGECNYEAYGDICMCTMDYNPVCGSDGTTYGNPCQLKCEQNENPELKMVKYGSCEETYLEVEEPCICTADYKPVCGTNGVTYGNYCALYCAQRSNKDLDIRYSGKC